MNYQVEKNDQIENKVNFNKKFLKYLYNFDWQQFQNLNNHLPLHDDIEACIYYLNQGIKDDIKIYPRINDFFNPEWKESQETIESLKEQIKKEKEGIVTLLNSTYNWNYYLYNHPEILEIISINSCQDIIAYFIDQGIHKENISLYLLQEPNLNNNKKKNNSLDDDNSSNQKLLEDEVNDWNSYIINNQDLKSGGVSTIYEAFQHYILYGRTEGRQLKRFHINLESINENKTLINFINIYESHNWNQYLVANADLYDNNIDNDLKACVHYLQKGYWESRTIFKKDDSRLKKKSKNEKLSKNEIQKDNKKIKEIENIQTMDNHKDVHISNKKEKEKIIKTQKDNIENNSNSEQKKVIEFTDSNKKLTLESIQNKINNYQTKKNKINEIKQQDNILTKNNNIRKELDEILSDDLDLTLDSIDESIDHTQVSKNKNKTIEGKNISTNVKEQFDNNSEDDISLSYESEDDKSLSNESEDESVIEQHLLEKSIQIIQSDKEVKGSLISKNMNYKTFQIQRKKIEEQDINFDLIIYKNLNPDLYFENDIQYRLHFIHNGRHENRPFSKKHQFIYDNYDWTLFQKEYSLENKDNKEHFQHYLRSSQSYNLFPKFNYHNFHIEFYKLYYQLHSLDSQENKNKNDQKNQLDNGNQLDDGNQLNKEVALSSNVNDSNEEYYLYESFLMNDDTNKVYFNYSHYFIYQLIDWDHFYNSNSCLCENNTNQIYYYFMNQINNFNNTFEIQFHLSFLKKLHSFDPKIFEDLYFFNSYLKYQILYKKNSYFMDLISINNYLTNFDDSYKLLEIPPLFEFDNFTLDNEIIHFTFIIYAHNVGKNVKNNLLSILYQNYKNWHIIYINDNSNDDTDKEVQQFIQDYNLEQKITYKNIIGKKNECYHKYNTYQQLELDTVCVLLNGNNWLSKNDSLSLIANQFIKTGSLFVYSGYKIFNKDQLDNILDTFQYSEEIKLNNLYRSHYTYDKNYLLCTNSNLLKQIDEKYYKLNNNWIDNCDNLIDFFCLAELSGSRLINVEDILYIIDNSSGKEDNQLVKTNLNRLEEFIRKMECISTYIPPIYSIQSNCSIFQQIQKKMRINNYKLYEEYNEKMSLMDLVSLFQMINEKTSYDHILIMKDRIYIHKYFTIYYKISNHKLLEKDFLYLGFQIQKNDALFNQFNKNNEFTPIEYDSTQINKIGCSSFICSRKFRDFVLSFASSKEMKEQNINSIEELNFLILNNPDNIEKSNISYYLYNKNLFITEDNENYYQDNKININNYIV